MNKLISWFKGHKFLTILLILVIGGGVVFSLQPAKPTVEYVTEKASVDRLEQTVSVTGSVEKEDQVELNFNVSGDIETIGVEIGDVVVEGQILAQLKNTDLQNSIKEAQARVAAQEANLQKVIQGAKDEEVRLSYVQLLNAQNDYSALESKLAAEMQALQKELVNAQIALQDAKTSTDLSVTNALQTVLLSIQKSINVASNVSLTVEEITTSNEIKQGFGLKNSTAKFYTESILDKIDDDIAAVVSQLASAQASKTSTSITTAVQGAQNLLERIDDLVNYAIDAVEGTLMVGSYTATLQSSDITKLQTQSVSVDTAEIELATNKQSYDSAVISQPITINQKQFAVDTISSNITTTQATHNLQLQQSSSAIQVAQAQYDLTRSKATSADISIAQAAVTQAVASLDILKEQLDDYQITAPFDGVIAKINFEEKETVTPAQAVITMLGEGDFVIKVDIPESDITKLQLENTAHVTLDAYGDDIVFDGKVTKIDPAETLIQDVVYYKVEVSLEPKEYEIKNGMTANVDILTQEKNNVLLIPQRAVLNKDNGTKFVRLLINNEVVEAQVTVGLRGDGGKIEVISGLEEGDDVIVFEREL